VRNYLFVRNLILSQTFESMVITEWSFILHVCCFSIAHTRFFIRNLKLETVLKKMLRN